MLSRLLRSLPSSVISPLRPLKSPRIRTSSSSSSLSSSSSSSVSDQIHPRISGRQRFYKHVSIAPATTLSQEEPRLFKILLDHRVLRTPQRNPLHLPSAALAACVAAEWCAQNDIRTGIQPSSMPMMSLASTAIDLVRSDRQSIVDNCLRYLPTDATLFLAPDEDQLLLRTQKRLYAPITAWAGRRLGLALESSRSMSGRLNHPSEAAAKLSRVMHSMDEFALACLQSATMESKSVLTALALLSREVGLDEAIAASRVEEEVQISVWGAVEGGHDMDRLNNEAALSSVDAFMRLLWDEAGTMRRSSAWRDV